MLRQLASPTRGAPETYFGLLAVDDASADVAALFAACEKALEATPIAVHGNGFAVKESKADASRSASVEITILGSKPKLENRLADAVVEFCDELMRHYASHEKRGVSQAELEAVRSAIVEDDGAEEDADEDHREADAGEETLLTLSGGPSAPETAAESQGAPAATSDSAAVGRADEGDRQRGRRSRRAAAVLFSVVGDASENRRSWRRGRALVRALDKKLAEASGAGARSVVLTGVVGPDRKFGRRLEKAGSLRRRDVVRPDHLSDIAQYLSSLDTALTEGAQDLARRRGELTTAVIVLVALGTPIADAVSSERYERLAARASIVWVMLGESVRALPDAYQGSSTLVLDRKGVAEDAYEAVMAELQD